MEGLDEPEYGKVIDICTTAALDTSVSPATMRRMVAFASRFTV